MKEVKGRDEPRVTPSLLAWKLSRRGYLLVSGECRRSRGTGGSNPMSTCMPSSTVYIQRSMTRTQDRKAERRGCMETLSLYNARRGPKDIVSTYMKGGAKPHAT